MSTSTAVVNGALIYILAFSALLFFLIIFFMIYFLVRYRRSRNPVPEELKEGGMLLEAAWIIAALILVMTMFIYGLTGFNFLRNIPAGSLNVKVHARQWSWIFEYGNGKKSPNLIVPLRKNVRCELTSDDVIHAFYVPAFRIQQDIVPGLKTQVWFNASTLGSYDILCAQYCGLRHSAMRALVIVVPEDQFKTWLEGSNITITGNMQTAGMSPGEALLFERGCISCHSVEGNAMSGPTFKNLFGSTVKVMTSGKERIVTVDESYIKTSITNPGADVVGGFPNSMPSGRNVLSDKEIDDIIKFMKTLK